MSAEHLLEIVEDKVATITLNRPDALNAVTREMLKDLYDKVEKLAEDPDVGAIVLKGAGRAFCSGGDVKSMAAGKDANATLETLRQRELAVVTNHGNGHTAHHPLSTGMSGRESKDLSVPREGAPKWGGLESLSPSQRALIS